MKGLAPLACKTDCIDAWVLAELTPRAIWCPPSGCPTPSVRAERERARFRLHLVRHRTALKNRIHATLIAFGHPPARSPTSLAPSGRELPGSPLRSPEPWAGMVCGESLSSLRSWRSQIEPLRGRPAAD